MEFPQWGRLEEVDEELSENEIQERKRTLDVIKSMMRPKNQSGVWAEEDYGDEPEEPPDLPEGIIHLKIAL